MSEPTHQEIIDRLDVIELTLAFQTKLLQVVLRLQRGAPTPEDMRKIESEIKAATDSLKGSVAGRSIGAELES